MGIKIFIPLSPQQIEAAERNRKNTESIKAWIEEEKRRKLYELSTGRESLPKPNKTTREVNSQTNWPEVIAFYSQDRYKLDPQSISTPLPTTFLKKQAWQLAVNGFCELKLTTKACTRMVSEWLTLNKQSLSFKLLSATIFNAEQSSGDPLVPERSWANERWIRERDGRRYLSQILSAAIDRIRAKLTANQWSVGQHEDMAKRFLINLVEGWKRCNSGMYWWDQYISPGLGSLESQTFHRAQHSCGLPACPECSLYLSEQETSLYDWEDSFGHEFPALIHLRSRSTDSIKLLKEMVSRWRCKKSAIQNIQKTCGLWIPTEKGYELQILIPRSRLTVTAQHEISNSWSEVGDNKRMKLKLNRRDNSNHAYFTFPDLPAPELFTELTLKAERELFILTSLDQVSPEQAWNWILDWTATEPGKKSMNRVWHGPGFRDHKNVECSSHDHPELPPSNDQDPVDWKVVSLEVPLTTHLPGENSVAKQFPRSWFSLESKRRNNRAYRLWDPYIMEFSYIVTDNPELIPSEYKQWEPKDLYHAEEIKETMGERLQSFGQSNSVANSNPERYNSSRSCAPTTPPGGNPRTPVCSETSICNLGNNSGHLDPNYPTHEPASTSPASPNPAERCVQAKVQVPVPSNPWTVEQGNTYTPEPKPLPLTRKQKRMRKIYENKERKIEREKIDLLNSQLSALPASPQINLFPEMQMAPEINREAIARDRIKIVKEGLIGTVKELVVGSGDVLF